jgi:hypothetical protein
MICDTNALRMIKWRIRWTVHVARMTRINGYWVLAGKLESKMSLEDPDLGGKMILQDRQYTCTVTLRSIRVTTAAVKKALTIKY